MHKSAGWLWLALALTGCATKSYPQVAALTPEEAASLSCPALAQALVAAYDVQRQIEQTSQFDALTVLGIAGDFGIGNGIARYRARQKAAQRLTQLQSLNAAKCHPERLSPAASGSPPGNRSRPIDSPDPHIRSLPGSP